MTREEKIQEQVNLALTVIKEYGYTKPAIIKERENGTFGFHFEQALKLGDVGRHSDGTRYTVVAIATANGAIIAKPEAPTSAPNEKLKPRTIANIQTGNPAILAPILHGYTYIEQHDKYTVQASIAADDTYNASAWHVFDGLIGEVVDSNCLDDALNELETQYGEQIRGWHAPQTLGI